MSWSKLGRWVCMGLFGLTSAAACGGRGSLPMTDYSDEPGGDSNGGTGPTAGAQAGGKAGKGGSAGKAGSAGTAGSGGAAPTCKPGTQLCYKGGVATCGSAGTIAGFKECPAGTTCKESGAGPSCVAGQICKPGQLECDATGTQVMLCSADGSSLSTSIDCSTRGQRCAAGACQSLMCQPNELFCDESGVRLCSADGLKSSAWLDCGANQYCDPKTLTCQKGICPPSQPTCNGDVATTCNAQGSGYGGGAGVDCGALLDRQCVLGACTCSPNLADCDGLARNGCEVNVSKDADNCGTCGDSCSLNHISNRTCNGTCNGTCEAGYRDCNGDKRKDGCEVSIASDVKNCGGCGLGCSTDHVSASCTQGVCDGACSGTYADCNKDKQTDGCETDSSTDVKNCGGCGLSCSSNHVKPECAGGSCAGACAKGYDDCNLDKQTDGCETNVLTDVANCGKCGLTCAAGESCSAGKCSSVLAFSGIAQNIDVSSLGGWTQCYSEPYGQSTTRISDVKTACSGSLVMLACRLSGSSTLQLAAYAPRDDVFYDTGSTNTPHSANGVGWYFSSKVSWGFAPDGGAINRSSCDVTDSSLGPGVDGDKRLCWHTSDDKITGGWRCGRNDALNTDGMFERLMFTAD